jgi:hypothetical protein
MSSSALLLLTAAIEDEGSSTPTVVSNNLWRREAGDNSDGIRIAVNVDPNGTFIDWAVASGKSYEYRAEAFGNNGTSTFSEWT